MTERQTKHTHKQKGLCAGEKEHIAKPLLATCISKKKKRQTDITRRTCDREREFVTRGAASSTRFRDDRTRLNQLYLVLATRLALFKAAVQAVSGALDVAGILDHHIVIGHKVRLAVRVVLVIVVVVMVTH
jgi:hypothetical protein